MSLEKDLNEILEKAREELDTVLRIALIGQPGAGKSSLINQIMGSNEIFHFQPEILTIVSNLETARKEPVQFRKCVLDAANLVDRLKGGDSDV